MKKTSQTISLFLAASILAQANVQAQQVDLDVNAVMNSALSSLTKEEKAQLADLEKQLKSIDQIIADFEKLRNKVKTKNNINNLPEYKKFFIENSQRIEFAVGILNVISVRAHLSTLEKGRISALVSGLTALAHLLNQLAKVDFENPTPEAFQKIINENLSNKELSDVVQMNQQLSKVANDIESAYQSASGLKVSPDFAFATGVAIDVLNITYSALVLISPALNAEAKKEITEGVSKFKSIMNYISEATGKAKVLAKESGKIKAATYGTSVSPAVLDLLSNATAYDSERGQQLMFNILTELMNKRESIAGSINKLK